MDEDIGLGEDELDILRMALAGPIRDPEADLRQRCINLRARGLLRTADPSLPRRAFCLSSEGWNRVMADRDRRKPGWRGGSTDGHTIRGRHEAPTPVAESLVGLAIERAWVLVRRIARRKAIARRQTSGLRVVRD